MLLVSVVYRKLGKLVEALEYATKQINVDDSHDAIFYRAKIYLSMSQYKECREDLNTILSKDTKNMKVFVMKIRCLTCEGDYAQAL